MQGTIEQESIGQRERRVITGTIDGFVGNYRTSENDHERAKTDHAVKEFLTPLGPERYERFWGYYETHKSNGHDVESLVEKGLKRQQKCYECHTAEERHNESCPLYQSYEGGECINIMVIDEDLEKERMGETPLTFPGIVGKILSSRSMEAGKTGIPETDAIPDEERVELSSTPASTVPDTFSGYTSPN